MAVAAVAAVPGLCELNAIAASSSSASAVQGATYPVLPRRIAASTAGRRGVWRPCVCKGPMNGLCGGRGCTWRQLVEAKSNVMQRDMAVSRIHHR